jgi:exodeoxyribonuclease VII small subunit
MKFSEKMAEIENIVGRLEKEALPLEEALSLFEKGVARIRECQAYLREAKQKVALLSSEGKEVLFPDGAVKEGDGE